MKRFIRCAMLLLALTIAFTLVSCEKKDGNQAIQQDSGTLDTVLASGDELSIVIGSHPSWPYDENFKIWQYFRECVGAKINVSSIPNSELQTKLALMLSTPESLPDMIHMTNKNTVDSYTRSGAFVAIDDYLHLMPNYTTFWDSIDDETREEYLIQRRASDGKTYHPQVYGYKIMSLPTWMYRKDIFEKNSLKAPETLDELYDTALELKRIYPESYPIVMRAGLSKLSIIGPQFKPYFLHTLYYDYVNEKWCYGAAEDTMRDLIEYFIKLKRAELLPPDYLTINTKSWEELVFNDKGFITIDSLVRLDYFNIPSRQQNPDYTWTVMTPPKSNSGTGQAKLGKFNIDYTGYVICNTGDQNRIENSIRVIDWMYSDEAAELLSWGKEGETYELIDGKRRFIVEDGESPTARYGLLSYGLYQRLDPNAVMAAYSEEQEQVTDEALDNIEARSNPINWLCLEDELSTEAADISGSLITYVDEMLSKFLLEKEPMSNWDAFQSKLQEIGVDRLLEIYEEAYQEATKK